MKVNWAVPSGPRLTVGFGSRNGLLEIAMTVSGWPASLAGPASMPESVIVSGAVSMKVCDCTAIICIASLAGIYRHQERLRPSVIRTLAIVYGHRDGHCRTYPDRGANPALATARRVTV